MLVLSRKPGQSLVIKTPQGTILIKTLTENRVGIEAPGSFRIVRQELSAGRGRSARTHTRSA